MRKRTLIRPKDVGNNAASTENKAEVNSLKSGKTTTNVKASRKEVAGVCKKICKVIQYLILILIIPPFLNYASIQKEVRELIPEKGSLYDVGWGQKMFKLCEGQGPPTVIFESPGGMTSDVWSLIYPQVAKIARVCVYDRAGLGFSERPLTNATEADGTDAKSNYKNKWFPFTVERMADDLYQLMTVSSQEPQPFILVGAELGALVSQFYAQMFEGQVLGMVLINPLSEDLFEQDGGTWLQHWYNYIIPSYQTLQLGAALGITRLALLLGLLYQPMSGAELPEKVEYRQKHLMCHPKHLSSVVDEYHFVNESFSQMKTLRMIKSLPDNITVTVINGNYYDEQMPSYLNKAWAKSEQTLLTKHYPKANHIVINGADKHMLYRNPRAVIDPVSRIIRQYKNRMKTKQQ
ncbi:uncharacterized protein LOC127735243 [Mytilus californianus]|uniref:uncharacterized protein LOC127735243 n=1 Tax=Mytilus californianus TaxID=6549 RepID=UPI002248627C|nr:uncharacterized protein LOC127735243 [Mytilus californianus]